MKFIKVVPIEAVKGVITITGDSIYRLEKKEPMKKNGKHGL
jgi:hypothetical protein